MSKSQETKKNDGRNIKGYENYLIFSNGSVMNTWTEMYLSPVVQTNGYYVLNLSKNGKRKMFYLHQLVAEYYLGHNKRSKKIHIDHIDNNKLNNNLNNLRIITARENISKGKEGVSGHKNITIENNRYRLCLTINNKKKHFGMFDNLEDAIELRDLIIDSL